jgi:cytochrome c5
VRPCSPIPNLDNTQQHCYCFTRVKHSDSPWCSVSVARLAFTLVFVAGVAALAGVGASAAMVAAVPRQDAPSTMRGVYSAPQAARGEETYMGICVSCHPAGTYKTPAFRTAWNGRPLSDLFDQVKEKMPKNDPASLTPQEYIQVVAYILKINGVPAGEAELPPDSDELKKIRIELPGDGR